MPSDHLSLLRTPCAYAACLTGVACASRHKFIPFNTLGQHRRPNCIHTNPFSDTLYNIVGHWPDKYLSYKRRRTRHIGSLPSIPSPQPPLSFSITLFALPAILRIVFLFAACLCTPHIIYRILRQSCSILDVPPDSFFFLSLGASHLFRWFLRKTIYIPPRSSFLVASSSWSHFSLFLFL